MSKRLLTASQAYAIFWPATGALEVGLEQANGPTKRHRWTPVIDGKITRRYVRALITVDRPAENDKPQR